MLQIQCRECTPSPDEEVTTLTVTLFCYVKHLCISFTHSFFYLNSQSAFLHYLSGLLEISRKNHEEARKYLLKSLDLQQSWIELSNACRIEMMWSYAELQEWEKAISQAEHLINSASDRHHVQVYHYLAAGFLQAWHACQRIDSKIQPYFQVSNSVEQKIKDHMVKVKELSAKSTQTLTYLQRYIHETADSFLKDGHELLLPAIEVMYESGRLQTIPSDRMMPIMMLIEKRLVKLMFDQEIVSDLNAEFGTSLDSYARLKLMLSTCHRVMDSEISGVRTYEYAIANLKEVIDKRKRMEDPRLVALAMMELGIILSDIGKGMEGRFHLMRVKEEYPDVLSMTQCMTIDHYLRMKMPDAADEFTIHQRKSLTSRKTSAADVQIKMLKDQSRRRSSSIGMDHSNTFPARKPLATPDLMVNKHQENNGSDANMNIS